MQAIYSSKLYRTSKRKDKIHSALANPVNMELVQQLSEYLDEPVKEEPKVKEVEKESEPTVEPEISEEAETKSQETATNVSITSTPSTSSVSEPKEFSEVSEEPEEVAEPKEIDKSRSFHAPEKKEEPEAKETSTSSGTTVEESVSVEAATVLYQQPIEAGHCCHADFVDVEAIRGTLNVRDDTKGVARILVKDNELWIYYQDKINLNSVMEPVIEVLNSAAFTNLEFNRLARTENAIVFEISCIFQAVQPIKSENE